jgi:hypothetical protein
MCQNHSKTTCCQNPEKLENSVHNCSKEQIQECHGGLRKHPCENHKKESRQ